MTYATTHWLKSAGKKITLPHLYLVEFLFQTTIMTMYSIFRSTFSSLLSLIYLNMENNDLKVISSYLFSNNKQKMSISLAYNKLDFEHKELVNNSWVVNRISPFAHTYNLRLLNLSHNEFKMVFDDWWINGHDHLDISFNQIRTLWVCIYLIMILHLFVKLFYVSLIFIVTFRMPILHLQNLQA